MDAASIQVSVVVLTWNSSRNVGRALAALSQECHGLAAEVIVVDNGSTDDSLAVVAASAPQARVVRNTRNLGVAPARNQGMRQARGRYVLLLDSDTEMMPGSLRAMVEFLDARPEVAVVGPKLVYPDGTLQFSCRRFPTVPGKLFRLLPLAWRRALPWVADEELMGLDHSIAQPVDYVIGACQLIRRSVSEALGGLDDRIFYGPEDVDFCLRAWKAGWEVWYLPGAVVIHSEQRVTRRRPGMLTWHHGRALVYYFAKHRYVWKRPVPEIPAPVLRKSGRPPRALVQAPRVPRVPKVLQLVTLSEWGGAQTHVLALARGLRGAYDVTIGCGPGGPLVTRGRQAGIRVVEIPSLVQPPRFFADLATLWRLVHWIRAESFEIVHCHSTKAGLLGRIAARLARVPAVVFTAHGWPSLDALPPLVRLAYQIAERGVARLSDVVICVSEHDRRRALEMGAGTPDRLVVVRNGVDPALWARPTGHLLERGYVAPMDRPAHDGACTAVCVARLTVQKDPLLLLRAWKMVRGAHRLVLIGDGPLRVELEVFSAREGLSDRVAFLGARDDVPVALGAADLFVLASRWEGLPFAVLEAMFFGLPVVATRVGGIPEAVADGETGILVPPGDARALAEAVERLAADPHLRRKMGAAGRRRAEACFTEARMLAESADVYARLLMPRGAAVVPSR
ncbi:MAG: glycosyltransferase [Armatimonadota bacterium]|nr:glycosyltransferase [Armatimonadota bacterium]